MQEILSIFHVDAEMLIAQLINFAVLMVLIVYVVVRPLRRMMVERETIIQTGVDNALHAETKLVAASQESEHIVAIANEEAYRIRAEANMMAERALEISQEKIHQETLRAQQELESQLQSMRDQDLNQFKSEAISITVDAVEQLLQQKFADANHARKHMDNLVS